MKDLSSKTEIPCSREEEEEQQCAFFFHQRISSPSLVSGADYTDDTDSAVLSNILKTCDPSLAGGLVITEEPQTPHSWPDLRQEPQS